MNFALTTMGYILIAHTVFRRVSLAGMENGFSLAASIFWPITIGLDAAATVMDTTCEFVRWMDKRRDSE